MGNAQFMSVLWHTGRREEMLAVFDTLRVLDPDDRRTFGLISNALRSEGRLDEVLAWRFGQYDDQLPDLPLRNWRLATDYMNLGLYKQAETHALIVHEARKIFMPQWVAELWVRRGNADEAAELLDWSVEVLGGGGATAPVLHVVSAHVDVLRDFDKARQQYLRVLANRDLASICEGEDTCIFQHAVYLVTISREAGRDAEAADWLAIAEEAFERMLPYEPANPVAVRTKAIEALLRIAQDRHDEALAVLRDAVFRFEIDEMDMALPVYFLDRNPLLDPLRSRPEFQALLADYDAYLAPMRERVLLATESGDWEALRQRTVRWIGGELE
jgi:tetratricopeptide (TPR) repeat protein